MASATDCTSFTKKFVDSDLPLRRIVVQVADDFSTQQPEVVHVLLGLCGLRLPELNLIPIQVIDPGKATVGFIHSFGVNLYFLLF
jgi:hypothetical protein